MPAPSRRVRFTSRMATVFVEHTRVMEKVLKRCHGLTATEFCILRTLYLDGGEADGIDFVRFLMLRHSSISLALSSLAAKGLVSKGPSGQDRRVAHLAETPQGTELTRAATTSIYEAQTATFWHDLTPEVHRGGNRVAALVLTQMRGGEAGDAEGLTALIDGHTPITPEFVVFCKVVPQRWAAVLREASRLSLSDFRVLRHVCEAQATRAGKEADRATDIARDLLLERSQVSTVKDGLSKRGLLEACVDPADRRNAALRATGAGEEEHARLSELLQSETDWLYALCDDKLCDDVNAWHEQMHHSINFINRLV